MMNQCIEFFFDEKPELVDVHDGEISFRYILQNSREYVRRRIGVFETSLEGKPVQYLFVGYPDRPLDADIAKAIRDLNPRPYQK